MNENTAVLSVALFGAILSLIALFVIWRKWGSSIGADNLPRNIQLVIEGIRSENKRELLEMKTAYDAQIADIRQRHSEEIASRDRQIAELERRLSSSEQFTDYLKSQLLAAGGRPMPTTIPQPLAPEKRTVVVLGLWPVAVDIASQEEIKAIAQSGLNYVPMDGRVTKRTVVAAIENEKPTILHFGGHSTEEFTEFDDGPADIGWWKNLIQEFPIIKVVFLNSCSALTIADALTNAGVIAAIAMRGEIGDDVAIAFAKDFYERLASGRTVTDAGRLAKSGLARSDAELIAVRDASNWTIAKG